MAAYTKYMRIAQVAPLHESVPPQYYGGTERIVSYLTDELVRQGHEVTLFASGDSRTKARLVPICSRALRLNPNSKDPIAPHILEAEVVFQHRNNFDIIHSHIDYFAYPLIRQMEVPALTTIHLRLDVQDLVNLYREFNEIPLVSISDAQRRPLQWVNWIGTVHHGLPETLLEPRYEQGKYLAFLGRVSPEKGLPMAIEIANRAGVPLKIAAKVSKNEREYFQNEIIPLLNDRNIEFIGEINDSQKSEFLNQALALLLPIDWPEPFGLAIIEALACGTPVITRPCGSVPEIVEPGVTGFLFDNVDEGVRAVDKIATLNRKMCREIFERRFSVERMASDYVSLYEKLINDRKQESMASRYAG